MTLERTVQAALDAIDPDELADLSVALGNVAAPAGHEEPLARFVADWLRERGWDARIQPVTEGRQNAHARLPGSGGGRSLLFNSHLDSELVAGVPGDASAWRDGDWIAGQTVVNDRGPMAAWLIAADAIRQAGVPLAGDLVLTAVCGEIGQAPVDEYDSPQYLGKGLGARAAVAGGVTADCALVAETSGFGVTGTECGAAYIKVTVTGEYIYTPRLVRPEPPALHPNAVMRAAAAAGHLEQWAVAWERRHTRAYPDGTVIPRASVGAIRGGLPFKPNRTAGQCRLYLDVRLPPGMGPGPAVAEVQSVLADAGIPARVECYLFRMGYAGDPASPIALAAAAAYRTVRGGEPPAVDPVVCSMWRDTNAFHEAGIPSVTFGPPRHRLPAGTRRPGHPCLALADLVDTARMYLLTAVEICARGEVS